MDCRPFPLPVWAPKRTDNAVGIEFRILLENRDLLIAELKFGVQAIFDAHTPPWDCHVLCLEGAGFVLVGDETQPLEAGESVRWPKDQLHQLWTDGRTMVTQMIEHCHQVADPARAWCEHQAANPAPR